MSVASPTPTLTPNPTPYRRGPGGIAIGLLTVGGFVAFVAVTTIAVLGIMLGTGTLRHTNQGWVFRGSVPAAELSSGALDSNVDTIFVTKGSGTSQTRLFTANKPWNADWAYSCPSDASSFSLVAQGANGAYPAGAIAKAASGAGNSNRIPAGTYSFKVTTDSSCSWTVGARPGH
jgi:hypothetical protein